MRNHFFTLGSVILFGSFIYSQQEFIVLDKKTNEPIPNVSISFLNGKGTYTDINGIFEINKYAKDSLELTSIGYASKKIAIPSISKIYLVSETTELEEVEIKSLRRKILKHKSGVKNINIVVRDFTYNEFVCTYIPFPIELDSVKTIKIKSIIINTTGLRSKKRRYYPFKVNLFSTNNHYNHPDLKDSLITGIKTSRKKGNSHFVNIDISDHHVTLPKNGVYVSFETLSKSEYPQENLYKALKIFRNKKVEGYTDYGAAVKTLKINPENKIFSNRLIRKKSNNYTFWKKEKDFIYDLTIEVEY